MSVSFMRVTCLLPGAKKKKEKLHWKKLYYKWLHWLYMTYTNKSNITTSNKQVKGIPQFFPYMWCNVFILCYRHIKSKTKCSLICSRLCHWNFTIHFYGIIAASVQNTFFYIASIFIYYICGHWHTRSQQFPLLKLWLSVSLDSSMNTALQCNLIITH